LAGYAGGGTITKTHASGDVSASANYPYAGGLVGYNYDGNVVTESYATGRVSAITNVAGGSYPYAGGLAGYNSGIESTIQNCYASGYVYAQSINNTAWAGGITASNASGALVDSCYSSGAVEVQISGTDRPETPLDGAVAGGIVGFNYFGSPQIRRAAALNPSISSTLRASAINMNRVAGKSDSTNPKPLDINIANIDMVFTPAHTVVQDPTGLDGRSEAAQPAESVFVGLGWSFTTSTSQGIWTMGNDGYPILQWQLQIPSPAAYQVPAGSVN
jgi:hypothetical protein